jgi:undecaprenyl-diphosphatase
MSTLSAAVRPARAGLLEQAELRLTAGRCRLLAALAIALVFFAHLIYLSMQVIDLAEDEAYYWDWSRRLDYNYYSKGPLVAWLIRASCRLFGDIPWAVRLPALLSRVGLALCTYWLARRLLRSDRQALGAVLLGYLTPMFLAGGLIITTDPPYLFFWALASCFAYQAIWEEKRWAWPAAGIAIGFGFLAKPSAPLWLAGVLLFLLADRAARPFLRTRWPYLAAAAFIPFLLPLLIWNAQRDWVTFRHVGEDIGVTRGGFRFWNFLDFFIDQAGVVGPIVLLLAPAVAAALWHSTLRLAAARRQPLDAPDPTTFLLCLGLPVFLAVMLTSLRKHAAANWCASAYFAFLILTARFLSLRMRHPPQWRFWRIAFYPAVACALLILLIAHHTERLYPVLPWLNARLGLKLTPRADPTFRVHGWAEIGQRIAERRQSVGPAALIMTQDYMTAAELAFYVPGQPRTYVAGTYVSGRDREPFSQYDIWPDRSLQQPELHGRDFLYVGLMKPEFQRAFARVQRLDDVEIVRRGVPVRRLQTWACYRFAGMHWPGWDGKYDR